MYQPRHVANALTQKAKHAGVLLSQSRLQNMLYFMHGCYSVWHEEPLLPEVFEAWISGPTIDSIARSFNELMPELHELSANRNGLVIRPPKSDNLFWIALDTVWEYFSKFSDSQLRDMAICNGSPAQQLIADNKTGDTIRQEAIMSYFQTITSLPEHVLRIEDNVIHLDFSRG